MACSDANGRANRYAAPLMELAGSGVAAGWAAGMWALQLVYAIMATWNWMHVEYFRGESGYAHFIISGGPGMPPAAVPCTQHTPLFGTLAPSCVLSVRGLFFLLSAFLAVTLCSLIASHIPHRIASEFLCLEAPPRG